MAPQLLAIVLLLLTTLLPFNNYYGESFSIGSRTSFRHHTQTFALSSSSLLSGAGSSKQPEPSSGGWRVQRVQTQEEILNVLAFRAMGAVAVVVDSDITTDTNTSGNSTGADSTTNNAAVSLEAAAAGTSDVFVTNNKGIVEVFKEQLRKRIPQSIQRFEAGGGKIIQFYATTRNNDEPNDKNVIVGAVDVKYYPKGKVRFPSGTTSSCTTDYNSSSSSSLDLPNRYHIKNLRVDPIYHRRGIGRGLLKAVGEYSLRQLEYDSLLHSNNISSISSSNVNSRTNNNHQKEGGGATRRIVDALTLVVAIPKRLRSNNRQRHQLEEGKEEEEETEEEQNHQPSQSQQRQHMDLVEFYQKQGFEMAMMITSQKRKQQQQSNEGYHHDDDPLEEQEGFMIKYL